MVSYDIIFFLLMMYTYVHRENVSSLPYSYNNHDVWPIQTQINLRFPNNFSYLVAIIHRNKMLTTT